MNLLYLRVRFPHKSSLFIASSPENQNQTGSSFRTDPMAQSPAWTWRLTDRHFLSEGQRDEEEGQAHCHTGHHLVNSQLSSDVSVLSLVRLLQQKIAEHVLCSHVGDGHLNAQLLPEDTQNKHIQVRKHLCCSVFHMFRFIIYFSIWSWFCLLTRKML